MLTVKKKKIWSLIGKNTASFAFCMGCIYLFLFLFGPQNILPSVAIVVGLMTFPLLDLKTNHLHFSIMTFLLFPLIGFAAAASLMNVWLSILCNFGIVLLILMFSVEPKEVKPYVTFLLCYIFSQGSPVANAGEFASRMMCLTVSGLAVALVAYFTWKYRQKNSERHSLRQQIYLSIRHKSFILRMALGLTLAGIISFALHLKKPMWISIVVFSLTQIDIRETHQRIKYRVIATITGVFLFLLFCQYLIPQEYIFFFIIFLGYIGTWVKEYKYVQIINTISAINANLVLFDSTTAIGNRLLLLGIGIAIVLAMHFLDRIVRHLTGKRQRHARQGWEPQKPPALETLSQT
ncbi:FUSC family protein [Christensenella tenuis]|uniref:FUSC family protein n=1 Tax=Christensenella tenuis TaxID=2763033 RepID=A0ABR7EEK0_9FIRM|nr:FUSC family protein [Christensenella tenuis]MBC5647524.1 FUSC family protein [Christensenella tenuis]